MTGERGWRTGRQAPRKERTLCTYTQWGSWSGKQYVCNQEAGHIPEHWLVEATPDQQRRIAASLNNEARP